MMALMQAWILTQTHSMHQKGGRERERESRTFYFMNLMGREDKATINEMSCDGQT